MIHFPVPMKFHTMVSGKIHSEEVKNGNSHKVEEILVDNSSIQTRHPDLHRDGRKTLAIDSNRMEKLSNVQGTSDRSGSNTNTENIESKETLASRSKCGIRITESRIFHPSASSSGGFTGHLKTCLAPTWAQVDANDKWKLDENYAQSTDTEKIVYLEKQNSRMSIEIQHLQREKKVYYDGMVGFKKLVDQHEAIKEKEDNLPALIQASMREVLEEERQMQRPLREITTDNGASEQVKMTDDFSTQAVSASKIASTKTMSHRCKLIVEQFWTAAERANLYMAPKKVIQEEWCQTKRSRKLQRY